MHGILNQNVQLVAWYFKTGKKHKNLKTIMLFCLQVVQLFAWLLQNQQNHKNHKTIILFYHQIMQLFTCMGTLKTTKTIET